MDGLAELAQLAHLLRVSAETANNIAWIRPADAERILPIARQTTRMAAIVDDIISGSRASRSG